MTTCLFFACRRCVCVGWSPRSRSYPSAPRRAWAVRHAYQVPDVWACNRLAAGYVREGQCSALSRRRARPMKVREAQGFGHWIDKPEHVTEAAGPVRGLASDRGAGSVSEVEAHIQLILKEIMVLQVSESRRSLLSPRAVIGRRCLGVPAG